MMPSYISTKVSNLGLIIPKGDLVDDHLISGMDYHGFELMIDAFSADETLLF